MAVRLIFRTDDAAMAANVGGAVLTTYQTIVIENAEVEALLRSEAAYCHTQLVGAELLRATASPTPAPGTEQVAARVEATVPGGTEILSKDHSHGR